ncbi:hypothetical protein C8Q77DRAFT_1129658 [Trametes polyzona]|nr:hypothetical protein C8Q77DRAFT_1129658 [Trametes polyzona]
MRASATRRIVVAMRCGHVELRTRVGLDHPVSSRNTTGARTRTPYGDLPATEGLGCYHWQSIDREHREKLPLLNRGTYELERRLARSSPATHSSYKTIRRAGTQERRNDRNGHRRTVCMTIEDAELPILSARARIVSVAMRSRVVERQSNKPQQGPEVRQRVGELERGDRDVGMHRKMWTCLPKASTPNIMTCGWSPPGLVLLVGDSRVWMAGCYR